MINAGTITAGDTGEASETPFNLGGDIDVDGATITVKVWAGSITDPRWGPRTWTWESGGENEGITFDPETGDGVFWFVDADAWGTPAIQRQEQFTVQVRAVRGNDRSTGNPYLSITVRPQGP